MNFAKMAADLDSHPKVRKAGRDGREVFLFLLRRNALADAEGRLPLSYIDPDYLADQLMMDAVTASHGVSRAVTAGLLRVTDAEIVISGWDDDWSKRAMTPAERKAKQRAKSKPAQESSHDVTKGHAQNVTGHACHALEEKRLEEKRVEENNITTSPPARGDTPAQAVLDKIQEHFGDLGVSRALDKKPRKPRTPSGPHQQAIAEFDGYYQRTHGGAKPTWNDTQGKRMRQLLERHGLEEIIRRIAVLEQTPPRFPPAPWDFSTFVLHFDKTAVASRDPQSGLAAVLAIANGESP